MNNSLIAFNRDRIYTSLKTPDNNPDDLKLVELIKLINELGDFGYIIDSEAIKYLSIQDIIEYRETTIPILYEVYRFNKYKNSNFNIDLEDWKKRHVSEFYNSGDFRYICEAARKSGIEITYLDSFNESDLYNVFLKIIESKDNPDEEERNELNYLAKVFINNYNPQKVGNEFSKVVLEILDKNYHFKSICDSLKYSNYKLYREERRSILSKMEDYIISGSSLDDAFDVSRNMWKALFRVLHPSDYKNIFPKVYEFSNNIIQRKEKVSKSPYLIAKELLDTRKTDEFVLNFGKLLFEAEKLRDGSDADIASLLCTGKLDKNQLLKIMEYLKKKEFGLTRYYNFGSIRKENKSFDVRVIPTIKEFIIKGLLVRNKTTEYLGKKVWLDPILKEYDFMNKNKRYSIHHVSKIDIKSSIEFNTSWDLNTSIINSVTGVYLWKGIGTDFKKVFGFRHNLNGYGVFHSGPLDVQSLIKSGYKYIIFYNRSVYNNRRKNKIESLYFSIKQNDQPNNIIISSGCYRNKFGGLIDLETGEVLSLEFDLMKLPTYNGNIPEAIVRYLLDNFRFSAYDFFEDYFMFNGASLVEKSDCDIKFSFNEYDKSTMV